MQTNNNHNKNPRTNKESQTGEPRINQVKGSGENRGTGSFFTSKLSLQSI